MTRAAIAGDEGVTHPSVSTSNFAMLLAFLPQAAGSEPLRRQFWSSASSRSRGNAPLSAHSPGKVPCAPARILKDLRIYFFSFLVTYKIFRAVNQGPRMAGVNIPNTVPPVIWISLGSDKSDMG